MTLTNNGEPHDCKKIQAHRNLEGEVHLCDDCGKPVDKPMTSPTEQWQIAAREIEQAYVAFKVGRITEREKEIFIKGTLKGLLLSHEKEMRAKWLEAIAWCSGSDDFQVGGKARKGWEKMVEPLLNEDKNKS